MNVLRPRVCLPSPECGGEPCLAGRPGCSAVGVCGEQGLRSALHSCQWTPVGLHGTAASQRVLHQAELGRPTGGGVGTCSRPLPRLLLALHLLHTLSELVICNKKLLQERQFQSLSVTAEKWISLSEVSYAIHV